MRFAFGLAFVAAIVVTPSVSTPTAAGPEIRTLKLYHVHSREKEEIAFKKDGRFIPAGLAKINHLLRDWRTQQEISIDPRLLDLVWNAYVRSGSRQYIQVIGGYRSPGTNALLRSRSTGVAKDSLHTRGKAMDFFLPDVPLKKLRDIAMRLQGGGVGYYPSSGSPFVHMDVGGVRHWPRMRPAEYASVMKGVDRIQAGQSYDVASVEAEEAEDVGLLAKIFGRRAREKAVASPDRDQKPAVATAGQSKAVKDAPVPARTPAVTAPVAPTRTDPEAPEKRETAPVVLVAEAPRNVPRPSFVDRSTLVVDPPVDPIVETLVAAAEPSSATGALMQAVAAGNPTHKPPVALALAAAFAPEPVFPGRPALVPSQDAAQVDAPSRSIVGSMLLTEPARVAVIERPDPASLMAPPEVVVLSGFAPADQAASDRRSFMGTAVTFLRLARFGRG